MLFKVYPLPKSRRFLFTCFALVLLLTIIGIVYVFLWRSVPAKQLLYFDGYTNISGGLCAVFQFSPPNSLSSFDLERWEADRIKVVATLKDGRLYITNDAIRDFALVTSGGNKVHQICVEIPKNVAEFRVTYSFRLSVGRRFSSFRLFLPWGKRVFFESENIGQVDENLNFTRQP